MKKFAASLLFYGATAVMAQIATPAPGEYVINQRIFGILVVKADKTFFIETTGSNGHICGLDGLIVNGKVKMENSACQISFKAEGQDFQVTAAQADDCRDFCGFRAGFEGLYRKPGPLCTRSAMSRSRKAFKQHYDAKNYRAAFDALNPVATQCQQFNNWLESAWISNDLAQTQFKLGDRAACLKTLEPMAKDAALSDAQIKENYPPSDAESYLPAVRAARTNLKLCSGA